MKNRIGHTGEQKKKANVHLCHIQKCGTQCREGGLQIRKTSSHVNDETKMMKIKALCELDHF